MRPLWGSACGCDRAVDPGRLRKSATMRLLLLLSLLLPSYLCCPDKCLCSSQTVKCQNQELDSIPSSIPVNTKFLFITGNDISQDLPTATLGEFSLVPGLHIQLAGNPWRCTCFIEDLLVWLKNSTQVADAQDLTCTYPEALRGRPLLQLDQSQLKCPVDVDSVLETSYVFLGLVLALIGVIFLLVLYLNRKGIKRWMYNIRDACRDHMEGSDDLLARQSG
uniref:Trophoblast glycoprotein n=1 Tax=Kryptolebias marmoratus TaxID=37003 RepID=A0A3Q2ZZX3_KRYMA